MERTAILYKCTRFALPINNEKRLKLRIFGCGEEWLKPVSETKQIETGGQRKAIETSHRKKTFWTHIST